MPALNEERHIGDCMDAIKRLALPSCVAAVDIVVVDNESRDNTRSIALDRGARVLSSPPGNISRARNAGANSAQDGCVVFLDADCEIQPDWLEQCAPLLLDAQTVAVGGKVIPPTTSGTWISKAYEMLSSVPQSDGCQLVSWITTQALITNIDVFRAAGGFDERLITCEDCDLGYRLAAYGKLLVQPKAVAIHHGESRTVSQLFWREAWRSSGNLALALSRPTDLRNWLSLIIPVLFLLLVALGAWGLLATVVLKRPHLLVWCLPFAFAIPVGVVIAKRRRIPTPWSLLQQAAYLTVYFLGRALGLFFRFPRLHRS